MDDNYSLTRFLCMASEKPQPLTRSTMTDSASATQHPARDKTLSLPELLESIVVCLDVKSLLCAQRVNKTWHEIITRSKHFRPIRYLTPAPTREVFFNDPAEIKRSGDHASGPTIRDCLEEPLDYECPIVKAHHLVLKHYSFQPIHSSTTTSSDGLRQDRRFTFEVEVDSWCDYMKEKRLESLLLCQPPCKVIKFAVIDYRKPGGRSFEAQLRNEHGITIGDFSAELRRRKQLGQAQGGLHYRNFRDAVHGKAQFRIGQVMFDHNSSLLQSTRTKMQDDAEEATWQERKKARAERFRVKRSRAQRIAAKRVEDLALEKAAADTSTYTETDEGHASKPSSNMVLSIRKGGKSHCVGIWERQEGTEDTKDGRGSVKARASRGSNLRLYSAL